MRNCWQFVPAFVGTIARGGCLSPASPLFQEGEMQQQFNDSKAKIVFCQQYALDSVCRAAANCSLVRVIIVVDGPTVNLPPHVVHLDSILARRPTSSSPPIVDHIDVNRDLAALPYSR